MVQTYKIFTCAFFTIIKIKAYLKSGYTKIYSDSTLAVKIKNETIYAFTVVHSKAITIAIFYLICIGLR